MEEPSFPRFGRLPLEIRTLIWAATLPQEDEPAMAVFGLTWMLPWADPGENNKDFQHLDRRVLVQMPMPMAAFVCHESRNAVLRWLDSKPNVTRRMREETQTHVYARDFDEENDLFYVPRDRWEFFSNVFIDTAFDEGLQAVGTYMRNLVLPSFTAYYSIPKIESLLGAITSLRTIYVVWGEMPQPRKANQSVKGWDNHIAEVQPLWEIHEVPPEAEVELCFVDPEDGSVTYEKGDLATFREEIDEQWGVSDTVPKWFVDKDTGEVNVPHKHISIKEFRCP